MESVICSREEVSNFLLTTENSGYGYGYGSGSGYGYRSGSGDGSGYYYCHSDDSGDGSGSGPGDGFDSGSGYGYRYDTGGIMSVNGYLVDYVDNVPTIITQVRGSYAKGYILNDDLSFSACFVAKIGSSFAHGRTLKEAVADAQTKELQSLPIKERIEQFKSTFGSIKSVHKGKEFYDWHHILTGSCVVGRDEFCRSHSIDLNAEYTVEYFLSITKDSYGGEVIRELIEAIEE